MLVRVGLIAAIALVTTTSIAAADCRIMAVTFNPDQNDAASTTGVSTGGSPCSQRFWAGGTNHFTSGSISSRPSHGVVSVLGSMSFRYQPQRGFKGVDHYSLRICGTTAAGSGCSTVTYNITVE